MPLQRRQGQPSTPASFGKFSYHYLGENGSRALIIHPKASCSFIVLLYMLELRPWHPASLSLYGSNERLKLIFSGYIQ
jgi:hypothetical protein